jgi:hypothetical protein
LREFLSVDRESEDELEESLFDDGEIGPGYRMQSQAYYVGFHRAAEGARLQGDRRHPGQYIEDT